MSFNYDLDNNNPEDGKYYQEYINGNSENPVVPVKQKITPEEQIQKFYSTAPPAPVFDEAKADRLRRMGRINQLGQGVKVLADMFATGIGANVRRRQPDQTAPALYQNYQGMLDRFEQQKDAYRQQTYGKNLQNIQFGINRADRDTATRMAEKKQADWMRAKEMDSKLDWAKWNADYDLKNKAYELSKNKVGQDAAYKNRMATAAETRADKTGTKAEKIKLFDPIQVKDKYGNNVKLEQADWYELYQSAIKDKGFLDTHFSVYSSTLDKSISSEFIKKAARSYYEYKQAKELSGNASNEKSYLDQHLQENANQTTSPSPQNTTPINKLDYYMKKYSRSTSSEKHSQIKVDYSKLNY